MNKISVIILAAGAGTRMKSKLAKVLHKISGKSMLYYSVKEALVLSDDIIIVLYHQASLVQKTIEEYFPLENITFAIQDHKNYPGTGGGSNGMVLNQDMKKL